MSPDTREDPYPQAPTVPTSRTLLAEAVTVPGRRRELSLRYAPVVYWAYRGYYSGRPNARETTLDLTHEFLLHFFLDDAVRFAAYLTGEGPRGRFLHYVLLAAANFRRDEYRREAAVKRGGGLGRVELDADPDRYAALLEDPGLTPDERAERAFTLDRLWRAAVRVRGELEAPPERPVDRALYDHHRAGTAPNVARIARACGVTPAFVRDRWDALRADRALLPFLTDPPPPYGDLAARLGQTTGALATRFAHLRAEVRRALHPLLVEELGAEDATVAAAEAARLLDVLGRMAENPGPA